MTFRECVALFEGAKRMGNGYTAKCPAHDDRTSSLKLDPAEDGKTLVCCHAGCSFAQIVEALGMEKEDFRESARPAPIPPEKWPVTARYEYADESGKVLYRVIRKTDPETGVRKTFSQEQANGTRSMDGVRRVLYRLPEILARPDEIVFNVEGEKDADNLAKLGLLATTNVGGANAWKAEYAESLRGRRVVVIPDNDAPGKKRADIVAKSLHGIAASVVVLELPGLMEKGDVSDWLASGGTKERLLSMLAKAHVAEFVASPDRLDGEREERLAFGARALSFGVEYLDHALSAILPHDLLLIGARSGAGKTEFATGVAMHNCLLGKRVHYFALEAEDREIERRIKYRIVANAYHSSGYNRPAIRYQDWHMGRLDERLHRYEKEADSEVRRVAANLRTFYRVKSFTSDDFSKQLEAIREETDLVILDHLHYVDNDDKDENRGYKRTVQQIRDAALEAGKPVLVVAHVRKADRKNAPLVPELEDFHGSSDIAKISTKAVMLAPAYGVRTTGKHLWATFVQVAKNRTDSSVSKYLGLLTFNAQRNCYEPGYSIGKLLDNGRKWADVPVAEMPPWADAIQTTRDEGDFDA